MNKKLRYAQMKCGRTKLLCDLLDRFTYACFFFNCVFAHCVTKKAVNVNKDVGKTKLFSIEKQTLLELKIPYIQIEIINRVVLCSMYFRVSPKH